MGSDRFSCALVLLAGIATPSGSSRTKAASDWDLPRLTPVAIMRHMAIQGFDYAFIGCLSQDFCLAPDGELHKSVLGGSAAYAAAGARLWSNSVALVSRVGRAFPPEMISLLEQFAVNTRGIRILPHEPHRAAFYTFVSPDEEVSTNPSAHFLRLGLPLPKELANLANAEAQEPARTTSPFTVQPGDLPGDLARSRGVHLCPADLLSHTVIPVRLKELGVPTVSLDPGRSYMEPQFRADLPAVLRGTAAFLPSYEEARRLFLPREISGWELAEAIGDMGSRVIVIKRGALGQLLWDQQSHRRWLVPAYPSRVRDPHGAGDAYCGGFLVGLSETGDPLEAALRGSVSASIVVEGTGALYAMDCLPGLAQARLHSLRPAVKSA